MLKINPAYLGCFELVLVISSAKYLHGCVILCNIKVCMAIKHCPAKNYGTKY